MSDAPRNPSEDTYYLNHYACPCGARWDDLWSCMCNDHCPVCDAEIEPAYSQVFRSHDDQAAST